MSLEAGEINKKIIALGEKFQVSTVMLFWSAIIRISQIFNNN